MNASATGTFSGSSGAVVLVELADGSLWPCHHGGIIGRDGDIARERLLTERTLSRRHFLVERSGSGWQITRFPEARNRTWVDGREMAPGESRPLSGTHIVQVAEMQFRLFAEGKLPRPSREGLSLDLLQDAPGALLILGEDLQCVWHTETARLLFAADPASMRSFVDLLEPSSRSKFRGDLDDLTASSQNEVIRIRRGGGVGPELRFRFQYRFPYFIGVAETGSEEGSGVSCVWQMSKELRTLAILSQAEAFQAGDIAQSFALVTVQGGAALGGAKVRIWIIPGEPDVLISHDAGASCGLTLSGTRIRKSYCPVFFDELARAPHLATAERSSPVHPVLREIGFADADLETLMAVEIRLGATSYGVVSFERTSPKQVWLDHERQFARCVADLCLIVLQAAERQRTLRELREKERMIAESMENARRYVERILPEPLREADVSTEWQFEPCEGLGGDSLGYHWIDPSHLAMYVLDVVGHGTGAALLSVSLINALRSQLLPARDFRDPSEVLMCVNQAFQMEDQGMMTCTLWYGVYNRDNRTIVYSSAGHPPALLLQDSEEFDQPDYRELGAEGLIIGGLEEATYENGYVELGRAPAKLFIFSDGAFELPVGDGRTWSFAEFIAAVRFTRSMDQGETHYLWERARSVCAAERLPDDYAMLRLSFHAAQP